MLGGGDVGFGACCVYHSSGVAMMPQPVIDQFIKEVERRERFQAALYTIYEHCSREPRDHLVHSILATIEGAWPEVKGIYDARK